jgi:hypothetical protein
MLSSLDECFIAACLSDLAVVSSHSSVFLRAIKGMRVLPIHKGIFATELSIDADQTGSAG